MKYTHIIWDWNGTLIDDVHPAVNAVNDLLKEYNKPLTSIEEYRKMLETPVIKYYAKLFDFNETPFQLLADKWSAKYNEYLKSADLMNGAKNVLEHIKNLGAEQMIISSCQKEWIYESLKRFGIENYFSAVSGADNNISEGKIERAKQIISSLINEEKKILVIGDMVHDYETAQALDADCILIPDGQQSREALEETGAIILEHISDIAEYLCREES